jgi:RNA polymerase sigma-70 factor, ECF subfamily
MAKPDTNLIERMACGDEAAFEKLYDSHARRVQTYLLSRGMDAEAAADLLQETFIAAWKGCAGFSGDSEVLTWLIGIARHKLADEVRRRERARASPIAADDGVVMPNTDERLTLQMAIEMLQPEQKELLHLVFVLGMNYEEAAKVLSVPSGTVKSRMFTLRKQLALEVGT